MDYKITVTLDDIFIRSFTITEIGRTPDAAIKRQLQYWYPIKWELLKYKFEKLNFLKAANLLANYNYGTNSKIKKSKPNR